ncbi:hypothetical protein D8B26_007057 [Coccidioides posadasii str. Silveira]|uniref:Uncharacterized protein n=3 Tax=Coccidioides posadasii TaxID=199306 RepID=E9DJM7_COCPS|nr:hypothetical protein CPC735_011340 [Coccidioides posadasii C735 delta SOWgp]EER29816.1 hypothetical protein CPC735_011340 [Coccidioides posadasii C735 delta SOWgp]EFW13379.1 conserved hypothetical protein [Coccidioides posadasii str. Silveira]KMM71164.1 hypothetical protein CPAG_07471 [Coccidioides posadasii RMSCC 3488]QVM12428.1 hypothetical protein D8B26_007057 [Coccidioides posadasii str. Silveira]|eukprot:XP_003071961.1 hypothetical protein CPC735_011340 [Coccidioides posadasii C735 delta SOWgp]
MADTRHISYGRGGAGNMSRISPAPETVGDMSCPTIKAEVYTTGRGGSGNMVSNDDPEITRARQDVDVPPPVVAGTADEGWFHTGRGGAANIYYRSTRDIIHSGDDATAHAPIEKTASNSSSLERKKTDSSLERIKSASQEEKSRKHPFAQFFAPGHHRRDQEDRERSKSKDRDNA